MKIGLYTDSLQDLTFEDALDWISSQGIEAVEIGTGNFSPAPHCRLAELAGGGEAAARFKDAIAARGLTLSALNCNGNLLDPHPRRRQQALPDAGAVPLVTDASSDIFSGPIDVGRFGLIYAGAQKNLGPSGLTVVIIREDLLARSQDSLPTMLNYKVHDENDSLYNTPNTFGVYILGLTMKWLRSMGGLSGIAKINQRKAGALYAEIDRTGFYQGTAHKDSRSLMNVTFRLPSEELEKQFDKEATAAGLDGLKGHRSVGGMRASIYNAFPEEGVDALVEFMREFARTRG